MMYSLLAINTELLVIVLKYCFLKGSTRRTAYNYTYSYIHIIPGAKKFTAVYASWKLYSYMPCS